MLLNFASLGLFDSGRRLQKAILLDARVLLVEVHDLFSVRVVLERFAQDLLRKQRLVRIDSLRF
mgnify:FL=1